MDHRVTQCPRCGTSFRVTEAHLAVAAGAVRCGSCLHIFNAREHWLDKPAPAAAAEPELTPQRLEEIEIDDDALFDDDTPIFIDDDEPPARGGSGTIFNPVDDDFEAIDDSGPETLSESFLEINSWEEDSGHSFGNAGDDLDEHAEDEQEWARKLLEDDDQSSAAVDAPRRSELFDDYADILADVPEIELGDDDREADARGDAIELSSEFLDIDREPVRPQPAPAAAAAPDLDRDDTPGAPFELEPMRAERPYAAHEREPLFSLDGVEQEPWRPHRFVNESRWPKVLWTLALIAMLLLALGQYAYFNFAALARGELRPWLARACEIGGCVLPPQSDTAQVRTTSLIVRSHPTVKGALAVDAILTNQAEFPQPYPPLQLQFTDLNGAPVAGRRFEPAEYLSGELKGARLMPVRQPVHIALEVRDPGSRAVNYLLTVAPDTAR